MRRGNIKPAWWFGSLFLGLTVLGLPALGGRWEVARNAADPDAVPQRFVALAANLSSVSIGDRARTIQIDISRWSTDGERDRLLATLKQKGEDALLDALQDTPKVGRIRTPDSIGYDLHFASHQPWGDGGRRIFIATDRPIGFWEAANRPRSSEYPFTLIEMRLKPDGTGEGKLTVAAKVTIEADTLVLENYAHQPVLLTSVKQER
ncbi:MAG: hypothetical protein EHM91_12230 [Planctomycetota bacterium]|nr:MAG: hypothetical protein EHM91_12230 [Planctomycetota bacterium]